MTASITHGERHTGDRRLSGPVTDGRPMSRRRSIVLAVLAALLVIVVLALMLMTRVARADAAPAAKDTLYQVSTYGALAAGVFDGAAQLRQLPLKGSVGMGTFTGLDGEMIVLGGTVYQARADGKVIRPGLHRLTPYACVTHFETDRSATVSGLTGYAALQAALDGLRSSANYFYAFRIHGTFSYLKIRSVPRQTKPYPTLAVALESQVIWELENVRGTMTGFWCPSWIGTVNVPGYHLHFIADDRQTAGHVLDVNVASARARADLTRRVQLLLPGTSAFADTPF